MVGGALSGTLVSPWVTVPSGASVDRTLLFSKELCCASFGMVSSLSSPFVAKC
jgi:hypothetical protein